VAIPQLGSQRCGRTFFLSITPATMPAGHPEGLVRKGIIKADWRVFF
jgi:hypothetical protein